MASNLVIVESPAKAKPSKNIWERISQLCPLMVISVTYATKVMAIDIENNFTPEYCASKGQSLISEGIKKSRYNFRKGLAAALMKTEREKLCMALV